MMDSVPFPSVYYCDHETLEGNVITEDIRLQTQTPRKILTPKSRRLQNPQRIQDLPSPRQMQGKIFPDGEFKDNVDDQPSVSISIGELNPFFEEIDLSSDNSDSVEGYSVKNISNSQLSIVPAEKSKSHNQIKCKRTSSLRRMLSTIGGNSKASTAQSQESISSSSVPSVTLMLANNSQQVEKEKQSLRKKLKNVSEKVRRQFSSTGEFIAEKFTGQHGKGDFSVGCAPSNSSSNFIENSEAQTLVNSTCDMTKYDLEIGMNMNKGKEDYASSTDNSMSPSLYYAPVPNITKIDNPSCLVWSLPNWVEETGKCEIEADINILEDIMETEKEKIAQKQPIEWAESVNYLRQSVGRDFRRGYLVLGERMQLPNMQIIRSLKYNPNSCLAVGCEQGSLTVMQLNYQKPLQEIKLSRPNRDLHNRLFFQTADNHCRIQMNQSLVGHNYDLQVLAWNNSNGTLLSSDEMGVIIGWTVSSSGCWTESFINDTSTSSIRDMAWSPDGSRIAIGYEDYFDDSFTGGVLVGSADGTRIFNRKLPNSRINCVKWYNESVVWVVANCVLYFFDEKGNVGNICRELTKCDETIELTSFLLKPRTTWISSDNAPEFAVVFKDGWMTLFSPIENKLNIRVYTKLFTTCADWSANGLYIAVGGMSMVTGENISTPRVNLYNYEGNLLQIVKIPGKIVTNVCWDYDSLHLAISTKRHIYFANFRPVYKVTSNGSTHCYAYTTDFVDQIVSFWNGSTKFTEIIPGKVIDIKCHLNKFALLCMDNLGVYHVFVFGETGVREQHLCITTMEPFAITITKSSLICLAPNAILNWNYNLGSSIQSKKLTGALRKTRQVHIDDFPAIIAKPGERSNHLQRGTINSARCMDAVRDQLCVSRESGRLQLYALPTLGYLQAYQLNLADGDVCQQLRFNIDGTRIALLTMNGNLKIFLFPEASGQGTEVVECEGLVCVSDILWASDMANFLCVLEGNAIHIVRDCTIVESISSIPQGSYLTKFEGLEILLLDVENIIGNPESPSPRFVLKLRTPTLAKLENSLHNGKPIKSILKLLDNSCYNHTFLRKLGAEEVLRQEEYTLAEHIYSYDHNYKAIRFLERIREEESPEVKRAESLCFLKNYEEAQHYYLQADRIDLAIKMWRDLNNWEKVGYLMGSLSESMCCEAIESQYEESAENQDWETAYELCLQSENAEGVMKCSVMMDDHSKLIDLSERLPARDPLLKKIGDFLACNGLITDAAKCFLEHGDPKSAMRAAEDTRHWDLAMSLSHQYNLPLITPSLVVHVKSLIATNNLNPAIQILDRCGKTITAGKLLVWKGLCLLQSDSINTSKIKKIFVFAALTLSKRQTRGKKVSKTCLGKGKVTESQELDLECLIPENQLKIMHEHNEWCWSDPWRGAEAIHFLILTQRFIYKTMTGRAFKAAMHLRTFEDILGSERVNSLVALTAINEGCFRIASNALLKLETIDEKYSTVSFNLFKNRCPEDRNLNRISCPGCQKSIPDIYSVCPYCNTKMFICIFSSCPIIKEDEMWTCQVCSRHVEITKRDRFDYCLLCHNKVE